MSSVAAFFKLVAVPYKQWYQLNLEPLVSANQNGFENSVQAKIKFQLAGHILGSAYIEIDVKTSSIDQTANEFKEDSKPKSKPISKQKPKPKQKLKQESKRIVFSGDLGATYHHYSRHLKAHTRLISSLLKVLTAIKITRGVKKERKVYKAY